MKRCPKNTCTHALFAIILPPCAPRSAGKPHWALWRAGFGRSAFGCRSKYPDPCAIAAARGEAISGQGATGETTSDHLRRFPSTVTAAPLPGN